MRVVLVGASGLLGESLLQEGSHQDIDVLKVSRNVEKNENSFYCDLGDVSQISQSLAEFPVMNESDVAIVNSGVLGPVGLVSEVNANDALAAFNINAFSNIALFRCLYDRGVRKFLVISSGAALKDYSGWFVYCQSKRFQKTIWESLSTDLDDISVRFVAPGVLNSAMHSFTNEIERGKYPDLEKFYEIRDQKLYQDPVVSSQKIYELIQTVDFFAPGHEYLDLRDF